MHRHSKSTRWLPPLAALALFFFAHHALAEEPVASVKETGKSRPRWGGFVEADLGVLFMSGGVGLFAGPTRGPLRFGVGFYRFDSPVRALSGAPEGFELKVDWLVAGDVSYHFLREDVRGPYVRAIVQAKSQRVENLDNGARRNLGSVLAGPEVGWTFRIVDGLYLAPRVGALYYIEKPQGAANRPIVIGSEPYDNDHHKVFDLYVTLGVGYAF